MTKKRDSHCYVPQCNTQYKNSKLSLFSIPKDPNLLERWKKLIPRADKELNKQSCVCELHFEEEFIVRNYSHIVNGETVTIPRGTPILKADAIPTIYPNLPKYLSVSLPKKRKSRECSSSVDYSLPNCKNAKISITIDELKNVKLPSKYWGVLVPSNDDSSLIFHTSVIDSSSELKLLINNKFVLVRNNGTQLVCETYLKGLKYEELFPISSHDILENVLRTVDSYKVCEGAGTVAEFADVSRFPKQSKVYGDRIFSPRCVQKCSEKICIFCKYLRKLMLHKRSRDKTRIRNRRSKYKLKYNLSKVKKMKVKVNSLKNDLHAVLRRNREISNDYIDRKIEELPVKQQQMVKHCFKASKRKSTNGLCYTKNWVLECILMHMKSPKLYEHIRYNNIMCLPSRKTIKKYISSYNSGFGFNSKTFSILQQKMQNTESYFKHGGLIIDEMKLTEKLQVKSDCRIEGFVDIGPYTPSDLKSTMSNHGLVILFQPLVGNWSQILGKFVTNNNISGELLSKLIIEATVLCENSGLFVNFITCDAASWNRSMWKSFGITASLNDIKNKMCHPVDISRYLYFISDFPHLIKCLRNLFIKKGFILPEGNARIEHIKAAWKEDSNNSTLKAMPKISYSHLHPNNFEKMRVSYAFQLFSVDVEKGLFLYRNKIESQYGNSEATSQFVKKINRVIDAMTGRLPKNSLYLNSEKQQVLINFLNYLNEWETVSIGRNSEGFLSSSTASGLRVTIKSTLDLLEYLAEVCKYTYLMTSRLSQDTIENIFGIVRQSSGCNDHPTPYEFLITIQCLSFYNLAKPLKSGNCEQEIINSLVSCEDYVPEVHVLEKLNEIVCVDKFEKIVQDRESNIFQTTPESELLSYFAGYVIRKTLAKINCNICRNICLQNPKDANLGSFIQHFDRGGLLYPSNDTLNLLSQLEKILIQYFTCDNLHRDSICDIVEVIKSKNINHIGCIQHKINLTLKIIKFYIMCRLHFFVKGVNKTKSDSSEKMKYLKLHRLK